MIDFPASPTVGQTFAAPNGVTYQWNGTLWVTASAGGTGDFYASGLLGTAISTGAAAPVVPANVITGNSGSWYNTTTGRYTPPAGRYCIFGSCAAGSASAVTVIGYLYKNGVAHPQRCNSRFRQRDFLAGADLCFGRR